MWNTLSTSCISFGSLCMFRHMEILLISWACCFLLSWVQHRRISPLFSSPGLWLPFSDVIRALYSSWGEVVLLPLSVGFCVLVNLMSAGNMVCRRDDVAGSIRQNTPGIFSIPSPCQIENTLPVFHHLMWIELHAVHVFVGSSCHIWCCSCQCQCFETASKVLSVKTVLLTIFAHRGWKTSSLIGSHCYIVIFSWETVVAKQFRNREKFKAFMLIRLTRLEI